LFGFCWGGGWLGVGGGWGGFFFGFFGFVGAPPHFFGGCFVYFFVFVCFFFLFFGGLQREIWKRMGEEGGRDNEV